MLLSSMLGDGAVLSALKRLILEKTQGNPLFMEEIVLALFERGILVRNDRVALTTAVSEVHIPSTIQGVLASRIDRLAPEQKELLQVAAVIGRQFSLTVLQRVTGESDDRCQRLLTAIAAAGSSTRSRPRRRPPTSSSMPSPAMSPTTRSSSSGERGCTRRSPARSRSCSRIGSTTTTAISRTTTAGARTRCRRSAIWS